MKKIIVLVVIILIVAFGIFYLATDTLKPTETLSDLEASKLANEAYLDILIDMEQYDKDSVEKYRLLETAMRIARELDLVQSIEEPIYREYVPRETVHTIIQELTGITLEGPIVEEDFYYLYDDENDYYYIVPVGTDWIHLGKVKEAIKKGNLYTINCTGVVSDYNGGTDTVYDNMKVTLLKRDDYKYVKYQLGGIETSERKQFDAYNPYEANEYGISELGRSLVAYSFTPSAYDRTILLNFEIHGFEDKFDRDGQVLVDTANRLMEYYNENPEAYRNTRIVIVPSANPDGLAEGTSNNGFGRCNASGIDLNRDFDAEYKVFTNERNKTLEAFSAPESRALRDLVLQYDPDVVIDFHGWENDTIGDGSIAEIFEEELNLAHKTEFNVNCSGYFSYWAHLNGAEALLVEFTDENIPFDNLVKALDKII
ncbi:MAG: succinylglutamate desuccinylase/aspartoacylase family protein [Clostridia bacterium]|nr:succinylglutamate desuccinylase/aspartoacylase family protein [Clostridia bacterium]